MECSSFDLFCFISWAFSELKLILVNIYGSIIGGLASLFEAIPAPSFLEMGNLNLPSSVIFFTDLFVLPLGASIIVSAYTLRFIIRRLPFVG